MSATIIRQNPPALRPQKVGERPPVTLPDFRNLGVMLRIILLANAMGIAATLVRAMTPATILPVGLETAALLEPILLMQVLLLIAIDPWLRELRYPVGCVAVVGSTLAVVAFAQLVDQHWLHLADVPWWRATVLSLTVSVTALV